MRFRRILGVAPLVTVVAFLASMAGFPMAAQTTTTEWPMDGGNPARTGEIAGGDPIDDPALLWTYGEALFTSPVAINDMAVIGGATGLLAVSSDDGEELWRFPTDAPITATPATDGTTIYAGDQNGILYALDPATGHESWHWLVDAGAPIREIVYSNGLVLLGVEGGSVIAVDALLATTRWRYATAGERVKLSPLIDGAVYVASWDGSLAALDAATGQEQWRATTGGDRLRVTPLVAGGLVFTGGEGEVLYGLDPATGEVRQRMDAGGWVLSLAATDDTLYVGTNDNTLLALDPADLNERWRFDAGGTVWSIVPTAEALYVGSTDGHLYAVDPDNGEELWRFQTGDELETAAAIGDDRVFVGGRRARALAALDPDDGSEVWRLAGSPFTTPPVVAEGLVFLGGGDDNLYAVDAASGAIRWRFAAGNGSTGQGPAVVDGVVYLPADEVGIYALDAQSGEERWLAEIPGQYLSSPAVVDGVVYVAGDYAGRLVALDAATGELLWGAPKNQARPAVADGVVYTKWSGEMYAHDAATGDDIWSAHPTQSSFSTDTIVVGDLVYAGDQHGNVYALDGATGDVRWTAAAGSWVEEVAAAKGIVYAVLSYDNALVALDAATGVEIWRVTGYPFAASPAIAGGILYAGSLDGDVIAFEAPTGAEIWRLDVGGGVIRWITVAGDVVFAAGDGTLFAIGNRQAPPPTGPAAATPTG